MFDLLITGLNSVMTPLVSVVDLFVSLGMLDVNPLAQSMEELTQVADAFYASAKEGFSTVWQETVTMNSQFDETIVKIEAADGSLHEFATNAADAMGSASEDTEEFNARLQVVTDTQKQMTGNMQEFGATATEEIAKAQSAIESATSEQTNWTGSVNETASAYHEVESAAHSAADAVAEVGKEAEKTASSVSSIGGGGGGNNTSSFQGDMPYWYASAPPIFQEAYKRALNADMLAMVEATNKIHPYERWYMESPIYDTQTKFVEQKYKQFLGRQLRRFNERILGGEGHYLGYGYWDYNDRILSTSTVMVIVKEALSKMDISDLLARIQNVEYLT
jgi:hypothetical protein